ncbi:MAG: hypothetical protein HOV68_33070 [Streptomycetaceae bacterium]|nr:hypothetical protein [Streptomycetaceae bacterium]
MRRETTDESAPRPRPNLVAPVVLVVFFLIVVLIVVKMGGGEDDDTETTSTAKDSQVGAAASAQPSGPVVAGPDAIPGLVRSRFALAVYKQPEARGKPVLSADHGTKVMVLCHTEGQVNYTNGKADPTWAQIIVSGKVGFVHVGQLDTGGVITQQVPPCA